MRKWRVKALIPFPLQQAAPLSADGGLPLTLEWASRLISVKQTVNELEVLIKRADHDSWVPSHQGQIVEPVELHVIVQAHTACSALEKVDFLLESICDDLAFRLQISIPIRQLEIIDISDPVAVGDERDFLSYPQPVGYAHSKFRSSIFLNDSLTEHTPLLRVDFSSLNKRMQATMRWYHKALAAPSDMDRFIFLMICLEILCEDYSEKVMAPFTTRCGHEIPTCPTCESSLERVVNGATLRKFLIEELNMDETTAKETWDIRQVVHGANDLSPKKMSDVPRVAHVLRACIVRGINKKLTRDSRLGPCIAPDAPGIETGAILGGKRQITEMDLASG